MNDKKLIKMYIAIAVWVVVIVGTLLITKTN